MSRKSSRCRGKALRAKARARRKAQPRALWRTKGPTDLQLSTLRSMGLGVEPGATRGEVADLIRANVKHPRQPGHRRGRGRAERPTAAAQKNRAATNPAAKWRFGVGQSAREEQAEIRAAQADGLGDVYMQLQQRAVGWPKAA